MNRPGALALLLTLAACSPGAPEPVSSTAATADLLVRGATVVTLDSSDRVIDDGAVAVRDGEIVAVGPAAELSEAWQAAEVVEADPWDILIPGLVNGHGHAAMTLLRGVADDLALMDWLENYIWPAERALVDEQFVRVGTRLAALEMIRTGTTTAADMYFFEDAVAEEFDAAGLRAVVGETVIDFPVPDHGTPQSALEWSEAFLQRWQGHPRIVATLAPHAPYTVAPEFLQAAVAMTRRFGVPLLIHLAETADEVQQVQDRYGASPVQHLQRLGLLGPDVVAAHAVWLSDEDISLLAGSDTAVVHNPESNMKLASGPMRVADLLAAGVRVGLGTDGAASNNDLDMFGAMHSAALLQKLVGSDPTALPATVVVRMATQHGARALGLGERVGSLQAGMRADMVLVDGNSPGLVPRYDAYSHLVYAARGADVRLTVVDGRVLYRDGHYLTLDHAAVIAEARELAARVREVVGH